MFSGLVLTSLSAVLVRAALFQRRSRSGWLEELDEIREGALSEPGGGVGDVVDADDIWTDLRDGGSYSDPHEISSLYATDATPDQPNPKAPPKPRAARTRARPAADAPAPATAEAPPVAAPVVEIPMQLDPPTVVTPSTIAPVPIDDPGVPTHDPVAPIPSASSLEAEPMWVQPAPHPIRPSEMWHPAELVATPLGRDPYPVPMEERLTSSDLLGDLPPEAPVAEPDRAPFEQAEPTTSVAGTLESELVAAADVAIGVEPFGAPAPEPGLGLGAGSLVAGPVGRRVRRDRPVDRKRAVLPAVPTEGGMPDPHARSEQSPLPTQPLAPAALPMRTGRSLPVLGRERLGSLAPSAGAPTGGFDHAAVPAAALGAPGSLLEAPAVDAPAVEAPAVEAPAAVAPSVDAPAPQRPAAAAPAVVEIEAPEVVAAPVVEVPSTGLDDLEPVPTALAIGADGLVSVPGTILRIGGARQAAPAAGPQGAEVELTEGWCWVAPGDGIGEDVLVAMPSGLLVIPAGAAALAVVEADRSSFVIVAYGSADLHRAGERLVLDRGAIVMIDAAGGTQMDHAEDDEIDADPIVAENLALDAEL